MRIYVIGAQSRPDETTCAGLKALGIDVSASDAHDADAQFLNDTPPDAILFEISQPNFEMAQFRDLRKRYADLPIVVISNQQDQTAEALEFIRAGAQDYFVKDPASAEALARCTLYAIERNRQVLLQQSSETRMREVLEYAYDGFITTDSQLRITQWNTVAERTFGWKRAEVLGQCLSRIVPHHFQLQFLHNIELYFDKKESNFLRPSREIMGQRRSGETFPAEFGIFRIDKDPSHVYCAFVRDITNFKQAHGKLEQLVHERTSRLTQSNEELYQYAKIACHDLQEPLRAIEGFAYLLSDATSEKLDSDCTEFVGFILDGVKRMKELIQSILVHSRMERDLTVEHCSDCNSVINEILTDLRPLIDETNASFHIDILPEVAVEHSQLMQLFQNLIGNSIKYRGASSPSISISATKSADLWLFAITDNGIGIDPQYADQVFDMFSRLHSKAKYSGTGIGLAICKKIVNSYGGKIWIESSPGQGAIFMFTLPSTKAKGNNVMKHSIRILLAEDTPSDVRLIQEALKRSSLSYELDVVNDGVEALEYLAQAKKSEPRTLPDIILLDLNMPRKNGHAVLESIKNDPTLWIIPVVLLTVSERDEDVLEALSTKMNYYLAKPVTTEKLFSLVKSIYDLHSETEVYDAGACTKEEAHIRLVLAGNLHTSHIALSRLADDPQERVRARVAENPRISEELQMKLASDLRADVRARLAENLNVTTTVLEVLAKDENADVRLAAISCPSIPMRILQALSDDENAFVSSSAKKLLAQIV